MPDLPPIHQAIELIEARLRVGVTVADMAAAAGYSLYHFIRVFNQAVFFTPYDYLMRRRLSAAAVDLRDSQRRVIDIAIDYQFNNHETFSRAFKRLFAMQPSQWRDLPAIPYRALMPALTLAHLEHIHQPDFPRPQIIEMPERRLVGLMSQLDEPGQLPGLWRSLKNTLGALPVRPEKPVFYAVTLHPETPNSQPFYFAALETSQPAPPTLVSQILPAGRYVCIPHPGSADTLPLTIDYLYHIWLPKANLRPAYPIEIENRCPGTLPVGSSASHKICIPIQK